MLDVINAAIGKVLENHPKDLGDDENQEQVGKSGCPAFVDIF
jgi:hypothetical protein